MAKRPISPREAALAQVAAAAVELRAARELNLRYGLAQTAMGMYPGQHPALRGAENQFWRACQDLVNAAPWPSAGPCSPPRLPSKAHSG
jgi:hypothetical protein